MTEWVQLAWQPETGRYCAVKRLRAEHDEALQRCDHPNVVRLISFDPSPENPRYTMELIEGPTLDGVAREMRGGALFSAAVGSAWRETRKRSPTLAAHTAPPGEEDVRDSELDRDGLVRAFRDAARGLSLSPPVKGSSDAFPNVDNAWLPGRFTVDWGGYRIETYDAKTGADLKLLAGDVGGGYSDVSSMGDQLVVSRFGVPNDQLFISDGAAKLSLLFEHPDASPLTPVFDGENLVWLKAQGRNPDATWKKWSCGAAPRRSPRRR